MKFEESTLSKEHTFTKKNLDFGTFYFFNNFVVSEMNDGIHLSWNKILEIIEIIHLHYGDNFKIAYISNKVNSYSFEPNLWEDFFKKYHFLIASVSVYYSDMNFINATIEKQFSKKSHKRAKSMEEAISWVLDLDEFKN